MHVDKFDAINVGCPEKPVYLYYLFMNYPKDGAK